MLAAFALLSITSCLPPTDSPGEMASEFPGEQVAASDPNAPRCHSGIFECADGENVTPCGSWYFDVNESGAAGGEGEITSMLPNVPVKIMLTGVIDEGVESYELSLSTSDGGYGNMSLNYPGPTTELSGSWSFTNAPEPEGIEISGGIIGVSCSALP